MGFYDLSKEERLNLVNKIEIDIEDDLANGVTEHTQKYFSDDDTFLRKAAYLGLGRIYKKDKTRLPEIINHLTTLISSDNELIRQSVIYSAGEIGKFSFDDVRQILEKGITDSHHQVKNSVVGALKKMGEKNPIPTLKFADEYINHPDDEIRREMCHGIELRGRTHPEEVLPILQKLELDKSNRVREMLIHVLGQISYKEGCLEKVTTHLKKWTDKELIKDALVEIISVHDRYNNFSDLTTSKTEKRIKDEFSDLF